MKNYILIILFLCGIHPALGKEKVLRIGVAGLNHGHVGWVFEANKRPDIEIVGIAEPNRALAERYVLAHGLSMDLIFESLEELLKKTNPEAVTGFGTTFAHLEIVQLCAPRGIHVMVEKPLAVSLAHAKEMANLAQKHQIHLLTNYETSWYASNEKLFQLVKAGQIGDARKIVVRDGDLELNGAGALMDFGCYGANLSTWLLDGRRPISVTAITQQLNPGDNPKVEDEATLILTYPTSQTIIEASWNWPIGRKDMEVYGMIGAIFSDNAKNLRVRMAKGYDGFEEEKFELDARQEPFDDPFSVLKAVVWGEIKLAAFDLYSLENNLIVMEILEAAKESAASGKTVFLSK